MTMPKKGTRGIEVNGTKYRWKASFYDTDSCTFHGTRVRMVCEAVGGSSTIEATAVDEHSCEVTFGPYAASQFITAALEKGWKPDESTNFYLSTQKEPLSIPTKPEAQGKKKPEAQGDVADGERRLEWARKYLNCDPKTGEPGYQELITEGDLITAMEAEAKHQRGE